MIHNKKKVLLTVADIVLVIILSIWAFWLCIYYEQSYNGSILLKGDVILFARNYLVPAQIFGITLIMTFVSALNYRKLRKKKLIGKPYIILFLFNTVPLWLASIMQTDCMIFYSKLLDK